MKTISGIILKVFGWKIMGKFPNLKKCIIIIAPHTSNWDLIIGKLYMNEKGVKNSVLVKKELFFFPMNFIMRAIGTVPVDRKNRKNNVIAQAATYFKNNKEFCLVVAPEGSRKKVMRWKKGFFYIAQKAQVPIVVSYIDYKKKEVGIKTVLYDTSDMIKTMMEINTMYKNVNAKYPDNFTLDKGYN